MIPKNSNNPLNPFMTGLEMEFVKDNRPFLQKLSKGSRNALMSGGLTAAGWVVGKKYAPEYVYLFAIIGNTLGNVVSELLD